MRGAWLTFCLLVLLISAPKCSAISDLWKSESSQKSNTKNSVSTQIKASKSTLDQTSSQTDQMNQQLTKIANSISETEKEMRELDNVLDGLGKKKRISEKRYRKAHEKIIKFGTEIDQLDDTIRGRQKEFVHLLSDQFSLIVAMHAIDKPTIDSVIMKEIHEACKKQNSHNLSALKKEIDSSKNKRKRVLVKQQKIIESIASIVKKRKLYEVKKSEKKVLLRKLEVDELTYRKRIKRLMKQQDLMRVTLSKLNIIRKEEIAQATYLEKQRKAELNRRVASRKQDRKDRESERERALQEGREAVYASPKAFEMADISVKKYGSSYQKNRLHRYRGVKTMSPIVQGRIVKKFGTYVDPIYKIKIFNESITLQSERNDAKVRSVLNGRVVFVGQSSMLGKMIIVAHSAKLHTIYAGLSKISPLIKNRSRVKKGAVIGRIKKKLIFQATKNSKYINPSRLIKL